MQSWLDLHDLLPGYWPLAVRLRGAVGGTRAAAALGRAPGGKSICAEHYSVPPAADAIDSFSVGDWISEMPPAVL